MWAIVNEVMASPSRPDVTILCQAHADGICQNGWVPRSPRTAQILFLVGGAPPRDDYKTEPPCLTSTATAISRGRIVNTIQCGGQGQSDTRLTWQEIARRGEGRCFAIAQNGGVAAIATRYDRKLAQLGAKIGSTYVAYGAVKPEAVKDDHLPDDLKKLSPEARNKEIARRIAERKTVRAEILSLSRQRDVVLLSHRKKKKEKRKQVGFDTAVAEGLRRQAAKKNIKL
jgi:hypothetical protein